MYDVETCIWRFECHHGGVGISDDFNTLTESTGFSPVIDISVDLRPNICW